MNLGYAWELIKNGSWLVFIFLAIFILIGYIRSWCLEYEIESLYKERDKEIDRIEKQAIATAIIKLQIEKTKEMYKRKINPLIRQRRYILEKLPLLKK